MRRKTWEIVLVRAVDLRVGDVFRFLPRPDPGWEPTPQGWVPVRTRGISDGGRVTIGYRSTPPGPGAGHLSFWPGEHELVEVQWRARR